ncbi:MAG: 1-deoxy-D-xylulose-5-phosphate reductoisomerase [Oscillospiraceae bacterium]|nr:1-deoxy-D-xylulose-5-phosphate reductoisomerase [Oscillospiraceae bacterium]
MVKCISVLGATGSIGRQSLTVAAHLGIPVAAITAEKNIRLLEEQARLHSPRIAAVYDEKAASELRTALADTSVRVVSGPEGLLEAATAAEADCVVTGVSGSVGLLPTLAAIEQKKRIALANKETLVCAGELVMARAAETGAEIVPVDSEHSAIFQSLGGALRHPGLRRILLTASGGPFLGLTGAETYHKTPAEAIAHPNWSMGAKISVDSATMMNKGLEFIEAMRLFGVTPEQITVLIHPRSVVHSAVEYVDGSVVAQLASPDMVLPIQLALTWPERKPSPAPDLDLFSAGDLRFLPPDLENTPCLGLAMEAAKRGGTAPAILSAANEAAVGLFLREKLCFGQIYECVAGALGSIEIIDAPSLEDILAADGRAREFVYGAVRG